ncbi:MAG: UPF0149 family protein [Rhodocyclaceae bacterium]|nr:UPF0149 family protein [Rhodocyclaceae bacterium]
MDLTKPLSDKEFEELERFLMSDATLEESLDISMLDGFFTALIIGPNMVMPKQWLPHVWGETGGQSMTWESTQQAGHMTELVMRHMNDIIWELKNDPDHYEPLIYEREHEGRHVLIIDEWCTGFIRGAMLDGQSWAPLFDSNESQGFLLPIILYGTESGWQQLEEKPELEAKHDEFAETLADCVLAIQDYWLPARKAKSTIRNPGPTPSRNDTCPCGSGMKFKRCCGNASRLN